MSREQKQQQKCARDTFVLYAVYRGREEIKQEIVMGNYYHIQLLQGSECDSMGWNEMYIYIAEILKVKLANEPMVVHARQLDPQSVPNSH